MHAWCVSVSGMYVCVSGKYVMGIWYVCVYVHKCMYMYACTCVCVYLCVYMWTCVVVVRVCVCVCTCGWCVYMCMHVYFPDSW